MNKPTPKSDCYADGDRAMMVWWATLRARSLNPLLRVLTRLKLNADHITALAFIFGLAFCVLFYFHKPWSLVCLFLHVALDGLDGPLARHQGKAADSGSFTDTVSDQIIIALSTAVLIHQNLVGPITGGLYIFLYTVVVGFAMVRNRLAIPYSWLVRPRFFVYLWLIVELYWFPGTLPWVMQTFTALLALKMASGFLRIRKSL